MSSRNAGLKIVWWIDHLGSGGAQQILTRLIEHMAQQGAKQSVICLSTAPDNELTNRIARTGAALHIIGKKRLLFGIGLLRIWRLIREQRFDVSVSFLFNSDIVGTLMSWLGNVPTRISAQRSSNDHYSRLHCKVIRLVLRKATCIVLNNNAYRSHAKRFLPNRTPICVIPNGVNFSKRMPTDRKNRLHAELMLSPDTPLIGCVGRLSVEKRVEDVIRAVALLEDSTSHLVLIGDGPQKVHLTRVTESLDLADRVHFLGERQDMDIIVHDFSLYVLASSFEGMCNSLMEAMVAGCPVAVSAIDANLTLVGNDTRGWTFQVGDIQGLSGAVTAILNSPEQVPSRTRAARIHIESCYTERQMLQAWQAELERSVKLNFDG
jgi:glycosyltransferase involved in cell wall biosynthesis